MRAVYCSCGVCLEASDNQKLFRRYRHHVDETHTGSCITEEQIHTVITANAYEDNTTAHRNRTNKDIHSPEICTTCRHSQQRQRGYTMQLMDGYWYMLPDGFPVIARRVRYSEVWHLVGANDYPLYVVKHGEFHYFTTQSSYDTDVQTLCDLTLEDLVPLQHDK